MLRKTHFGRCGLKNECKKMYSVFSGGLNLLTQIKFKNVSGLISKFSRETLYFISNNDLEQCFSSVPWNFNGMDYLTPVI